MTDKTNGCLYLIPVPIDQNAKESILLENHRKIVERLDYFIVENEKTARFHLSALNLQKPINQLHFEVGQFPCQYNPHHNLRMEH